eukprot:m.162237 g.162237  ORF g.162237 m.162237 type:complete len:385 (-) comp13405_c2_seq1:1354-2508(-)
MTHVFHLYLNDCGLGFTIAGGSDSPNEDGETSVTVSRVDARGAAIRAGLRTGDKIISVNNKSLVNVTHADAVNIIKEAIPTMRLTINVDRPTSSLESVKADEGSFDRVTVARKAYKSKDEDMSRIAHELGSSPELHQTEAGQYVKAAVFGGLDGIITTFAVVASVAGANLATGVVILMGFANLVADGISMGVGEYLSGLSEKQYTISERNREEWEFDCNPDGERKEMIDLYLEKGFSQEEADTIMGIMCGHKDFFIDHMMVQELGLMPPDEDESPAKNGAVMFFSFLIFGLIPLISYLAFQTVDFGSEKKKEDALFGIACALTACALFALGAIKSKFSSQSWFMSGLSVLFNGGLAAAAAYLIGFGLEQLVDLNNCPTLTDDAP